MKKSLKPLLLGCLALLFALPPLPAYAWNGAGHRLVAAIAWRKMTPTARQAASKLLQQHPDYLKWTPRSYRGNADADYLAFIEASTWPDDIRHDRRFDAHPSAAERPLPGFPDMGQHGDWHFMNLPFDSKETGRSKRPARGEIDSRLDELLQRLDNPRAPFRPYALPWVIHLVADLHQPLHVVSRNDDEGGNRQPILDPRRRPPQTNLHAFWDQLPGHGGLRGDRLERQVDEMLTHASPTAYSGGVASWRDESLRIARELGYPSANLREIPVISDGWRSRAESAAQQRLVDAGLRLADRLNHHLR